MATPEVVQRLSAGDRKVDSLYWYGRKALRFGTVLSRSHGITYPWHGDVMSLIEKVEAQVDAEKVKGDGAEAVKHP